MNGQAMNSITSLIEDQLNIAVASALEKVLDGNMLEKADLMYLTPALDGSGMLELIVNDEDGQVSSPRFQGAKLIIDPMALVTELKESIVGEGGEPDDDVRNEYRATIARMREACDALESMLGAGDQ
jgi:hypothetical protein